MCLSNLQKKYSKSLSWSWNLNFPPITENSLFKFQAQDSSDLESLFCRFEKRIRAFWKKATKGKTKKAFFNFLLQGSQKSLTIQLEVGAISIVNGPLLLGMQMPSMAIRVVEFSNGVYKIRKILNKNQHTQRKLLNFEN